MAAINRHRLFGPCQRLGTVLRMGLGHCLEPLRACLGLVVTERVEDRAGLVERTPLLVVAGDIDPIMDARDIGTRVNASIDAGLPLTWRLEQGRGHTLMVGDALPEYVDWLLAVRR